jgi:arsenate reductase
MAGGILTELLRTHGIDAEVRTAGLYPGHAVSKHTISVMTEIGIDVSRDSPKPVDEPLIAWADTVIPVDTRYSTELVERFPDVVGKLSRLGRDVADPVGKDLARYRATRDELSELLAAFVGALSRPRHG